MGCLQSKAEVSDLQPNVFRVANVDENGQLLCNGLLEITENDLILFRDGRDSTVWPLHSLRRYGFEEGVFSFESGRRCETGEGIYAFKCRTASLLFRTLQQQILLRNAMILNPASRLSPTPHGRQTLQASVVHRSSVDNGQPSHTLPSVINGNLPSIISDAVPRNIIQSPRSPSSADILEVMPLYPRTQNPTNQVTNVYQLRHIKREHNNNHNDIPLDTRRVYSNDLIRDLAILRNTLRQETALNTLRDIEDETRILENVAKQSNTDPLSPTLSIASEQYAQLSMELQQLHQKHQEQIQQKELQVSQDQQEGAHHQPELLKQHSQLDQLLPKSIGAPRLYMNIAPNEATLPVPNTSDPRIPSTPLIPKPIEYCNLILGNKVELNSYANLAMGELGDCLKNSKQIFSFSLSEYKQKFTEFESITPMSPVEEIVNYAVLDIGSNKEVANNIAPDSSSTKNESTLQARRRLSSQASTDKSNGTDTQTGVPAAAIGYTTIDFDKTVALTSVATGEEVSDGVEGCRKTRHNSCNIICSSGNPTNDKIKM